MREAAPFHCGSDGEMHADVALGQRAVDRIGQRMHAHIGVRMADQPAMVRHAHPAEPHMIAGPEGMHVEAVAGADVNSVSSFFRGRA